MKPVQIVLAGALVLTAAACSRETPAPKAEEVRPVRVMTVGGSSAPRGFEYAGEVRPRHETRLSFRVGGKITERLVEVGSVVRAGQPVARSTRRPDPCRESARRRSPARGRPRSPTRA
jgi:multidrug efflux pump subunit AcrA (membrane-fusion protein)